MMLNICSKARLATLLFVGCALLAGSKADAQVRVTTNRLPDFATSFNRLAFLPVTVPEGLDPVLVEQVVYPKLAKRFQEKLPYSPKLLPPVISRQSMFELGVLEAVELTPEKCTVLAEKMGVDAFAFVAITSYVSDVDATSESPFSTPGLTAVRKSKIEFRIVTKDGRLVLRSVGYGTLELRSFEGVVSKSFDEIFDFAFNPAFFEARKAAAKAVKE